MKGALPVAAAVEKGELHGWVLPSLFDEHAKYLLKKKTLQENQATLRSFYCVDSKDLNLESNLKWALNYLADQVSMFQGHARKREEKQFIRRTCSMRSMQESVHGQTRRRKRARVRELH